LAVEPAIERPQHLAGRGLDAPRLGGAEVVGEKPGDTDLTGPPATFAGAHPVGDGGGNPLAQQQIVLGDADVAGVIIILFDTGLTAESVVDFEFGAHRLTLTSGGGVKPQEVGGVAGAGRRFDSDPSAPNGLSRFSLTHLDHLHATVLHHLGGVALGFIQELNRQQADDSCASNHQEENLG